MMNKTRLVYSFLLFIVLGITFSAQAANQPIYKVGIYQNAPKIYRNVADQPVGFFPELLESIAREEGFSLEYVDCTWDTCMKMLQNDQIDILPDVAVIESRQEFIAFNKEPVIQSWSEVFVHQDKDVHSITDLNKLKIAMLKGSAQANSIPDTIKQYNISPRFIFVTSFSEAFDMVEAGKADAAIVNRYFGLMHFQKHNLIKTGIMFQPTDLMFAFPKSGHQELINHIDERLRIYKMEQNSIYFQLIDKYLMPSMITELPTWWRQTLIFFLIIIFTLAILIVLYRKGLAQKKLELERQMLLNHQKDRQLILQAKYAIMGEMIAMIAHQWKQPLSAISTATLNLKIMTDLNLLNIDTIHSIADKIESQVQHASETINVFRGFFQPHLKCNTVVLSDVVNQTFKLVGEVIRKQNIKMTLSDSGTLSPITLNDKELIQVLLNLISNAKDALLEADISEKKIEISIYEEENIQKIYVCDNGKGVSDTDREQIFNSYYTTKSDDNGTGLGLYMSKMIIEDHLQGKLYFESSEKGTCFIIELPKQSDETLH